MQGIFWSLHSGCLVLSWWLEVRMAHQAETEWMVVPVCRARQGATGDAMGLADGGPLMRAAMVETAHPEGTARRAATAATVDASSWLPFYKAVF